MDGRTAKGGKESLRELSPTVCAWGECWALAMVSGQREPRVHRCWSCSQGSVAARRASRLRQRRPGDPFPVRHHLTLVLGEAGSGRGVTK